MSWIIIVLFVVTCTFVFSLPTDWAKGYSLKRGIIITLIIFAAMLLHHPIIFWLTGSRG